MRQEIEVRVRKLVKSKLDTAQRMAKYLREVLARDCSDWPVPKRARLWAMIEVLEGDQGYHNFFAIYGEHQTVEHEGVEVHINLIDL